MADPAIGIDRSTDTPGYTPFIVGDRANGDRSFRTAPDAASAHEDLASLIRIGSSMLESGADLEATECFRKALELADQTLGSGNPDLILILNDLTRLYLKQSRFADAEPLLLRLLDMKRSKGEDHPEVATVLASLAGVRQALGRHESAEQLWRRVLEIRESTLAPNHFAIATALEHLGDACAARGNIREALPAFQRALTIRERTLGESHPSLRTSRERIADLQLQAADDSLDPSQGMAAVPSPERYRLLSGDQLRLNAPTPVTREPSAVVAREANYSGGRQTRVVLQIPQTEAALSQPAKATGESENASVGAAMPNGAVPYRDALESIREEVEQPGPSASLGTRISAIVTALTVFFTKRQTVAATIVVVLTLLSLAVAKEHAWGELDQNTTNTGAATTQPTNPVPAMTASALATPIRYDASSANAAARTTAPKAVAVKPRVEDKPARKADETSKSENKKFSVPTLSSAVMSHLDSVVSKAGAASPRETFNVQPTAIAFAQRSSFEASEQASAPTRARLIGELPTPRIPAQAAEVEGEVRVRFTVDAQGHPQMSTFSVVTSPSPLLTAAVRKVIPEMRFDPARSGGADARAISDVVETSFRFAMTNR